MQFHPQSDAESHRLAKERVTSDTNGHCVTPFAQQIHYLPSRQRMDVMPRVQPRNLFHLHFTWLDVDDVTVDTATQLHQRRRP